MARAASFGWAALNASMVYIAGAQNAGGLSEDLAGIHERIRTEVGYD